MPIEDWFCKTCKPQTTTHRNGIYWLGLTDDAQVILLCVLHLVSAHLTHRLRILSQGGHRGAARRSVLLSMFELAVTATVVGLRALCASWQVVAKLAAVEAPKDRIPQLLFLHVFSLLSLLAVLPSVMSQAVGSRVGFRLDLDLDLDMLLWLLELEFESGL